MKSLGGNRLKGNSPVAGSEVSDAGRGYYSRGFVIKKKKTWAKKSGTNNSLAEKKKGEKGEEGGGQFGYYDD